MKKVLVSFLVILSASSFLTAADNGNGVDALAGQLKALQGQLTALQKRLDSLPIAAPPVQITMPEQIEVILSDYLQKGNVPFDKFVEYHGLLESCREKKCVAVGRIKQYELFGAQAALTNFIKQFYEPFLKGKDSDPITLQQALPVAASKVAEYMGQEGDDADFKDVLDAYSQFWKVYRENLPQFPTAEQTSNLEQFGETYYQIILMALNNTINHFDDDRNYKGDGLSKEPFTQDDLDLYRAAYTALVDLNKALPGKDAAFVEEYNSWLRALVESVDKKPVRSNKPSRKEDYLIKKFEADITQAQAQKEAQTLDQKAIPAVLKTIENLRAILEGLGQEIDRKTAQFYAELCLQTQCAPAFPIGNNNGSSSGQARKSAPKHYRTV